jgi:hypothetical protein
MFPSTQPMNAPEFRRAPPQPPRVARVDTPPLVAHDPLHTTLNSLTPSLMQDLMRFEVEPGGQRRELLEVLAACVRHTQPLAIRLAWEPQALTLSVFPLDRLVHCPMPMAELLAGDLAALRVLLVQPAALRPPGNAERARVGQPAHYAPLGPLLWAVALRGARPLLLPELAGHAAYRVAPGISWAGLDVPVAMAACIDRLRRQTSNLREIAEWQGIGTERAMRLLNALYLQSGLIVSRTHPAATNEGWSGYK